MSAADRLIEIRGDDDASKESTHGALTRQDIALAIFERLGNVSRREAKRLTDSVIDEMAATLVSGETLKLHDFGSFVVREKRERTGRNPRTGAPVPIEARRTVVFKASPSMKAAINGARANQRAEGSDAKREDDARNGGMPSFASTLDKA